METHTHTINTHAHNKHKHTHIHTMTDCSRNWVLRLVGAKILWEDKGFQFGFKRWQGWAVSKVLCEWIPNALCHLVYFLPSVWLCQAILYHYELRSATLPLSNSPSPDITFLVTWAENTKLLTFYVWTTEHIPPPPPFPSPSCNHPGYLEWKHQISYLPHSPGTPSPPPPPIVLSYK